jgi:hypothetical protein
MSNLLHFHRAINIFIQMLCDFFEHSQLNGAFGIDFSNDVKDAESADKCLKTVGKGILSHGAVDRNLFHVPK